MSNKGQLLQDPFLNALRREHVPVSIYLVNGIKLQGQIESFDQYVVLLRNTITQMVYKHAILQSFLVVPSTFLHLSKGMQAASKGVRVCDKRQKVPGIAKTHDWRHFLG